MARGRPKKGTVVKKTSHIRVDDDLATMIGIIVRLTQKSQSAIAGPLLRPAITKEFLELLPGLEQLAGTSPEIKQQLESLAPVIEQARLDSGERTAKPSKRKAAE
jgi:hypothetical protein